MGYLQTATSRSIAGKAYMIPSCSIHYKKYTFRSCVFLSQWMHVLQASVAEPDPGSGAFLTSESSSRIRDGKKCRSRIRDVYCSVHPRSCQPWVRDPEWKKVGSGIRHPASGINIPDPQQCIRQKIGIKWREVCLMSNVYEIISILLTFILPVPFCLGFFADVTLCNIGTAHSVGILWHAPSYDRQLIKWTIKSFFNLRGYRALQT